MIKSSISAFYIEPDYAPETGGGAKYRCVLAEIVGRGNRNRNTARHTGGGRLWKCRSKRADFYPRYPIGRWVPFDPHGADWRIGRQPARFGRHFQTPPRIAGRISVTLFAPFNAAIDQGFSAPPRFVKVANLAPNQDGSKNIDPSSYTVDFVGSAGRHFGPS